MMKRSRVYGGPTMLKLAGTVAGQYFSHQDRVDTRFWQLRDDLYDAMVVAINLDKQPAEVSRLRKEVQALRAELDEIEAATGRQGKKRKHS